ncbi:MAG: hypothetical protein A2V93_03045 [Ignavibacteria bacterium RBG_16_34_14]|nr:MAG: hypothetical protein A2V93_03045 [Ignavibacteria bacterium RBG_16_34_14]
MGQQQILLIVLGIIIVGIAIAISIQLFRQGAIDNKRDLLVNECNSLASMAIGYYKKPREFGGGGRSFLGWAIPGSMQSTTTGNYTITIIQQDELEITGTGTEVVTGEDSIEVRTTVTSDSYNTLVIR